MACPNGRRYGRYGNPKKLRSTYPRPARALTVGRYGRYGKSKKLRSVYPRPARALTVGRYGWYGNPKSPIARWMQGGGVGAAGFGYLEILKNAYRESGKS